MKKWIAVAAIAIVGNYSLFTTSTSYANEVSTNKIILTKFGGHHGSSHVSGHHGSSHVGKSHGSSISGKIKSKSNSNSSKKSGKTNKSDSKASDKTKSSSKSSEKSNSKNNKNKSSLDLNKKEKNIFNNGGKVTDNSTLKKFANQADTKDSNKNAARIFKENGYGSYNYNYYKKQSIFKNPWFWLYMMNHNKSRYGYNTRQYNKNHESKFYLQGYKDGYDDGKNNLNEYNDLSKNDTKKDKFNNNQEKSEYLQGYKDGIEDSKK